MNPYLTDDEHDRRIAAAAQRGVTCASSSPRLEQHTTQHALEHAYHSCWQACAICNYPGAVVHAKVIVVRRPCVRIGTLNLDAWAMYRNSEIVVTVTDPATVALLDERLFAPDVAKSSLGQPPEGSKNKLRRGGRTPSAISSDASCREVAGHPTSGRRASNRPDPRSPTVKYVILIHSNPVPWDHPTGLFTPRAGRSRRSRAAGMDRQFDALMKEITDSGEFVIAEALAAPGSSTRLWLDP